MSRSVEEYLSLLDRVDAPDQWTEIVARADGASSDSTDQRSEAAFEPTLRDVSTDNSQNRGHMDRRAWLTSLGAVAAAVVVVVSMFAVLDVGGGSSDDESPATNPPTPTPTQTLPLPFGENAALQVTDAYFESYNSGDLQSLLTLFTADATFALGLGDMSRSEFDELTAWNLSQGTVLTTPECEASEVEVGTTVTVSCGYDHLDSVVQAVDGPPVPVVLNLTVTPAGISDLDRVVEPSDFTRVGGHLSRWITLTHPDVAGDVGFREWSSVEDAQRGGTLTAEYAREWAIYLEENDCVDEDSPLPFHVTC